VFLAMRLRAAFVASRCGVFSPAEFFADVHEALEVLKTAAGSKRGSRKSPPKRGRQHVGNRS